MNQIYINANKLLEEQLEKLSNERIKNRIRNDKVKYIRLVVYNLTKAISNKEKNFYSKKQLINWFSAPVNYKLSIKQYMRIGILQFLLISKWYKNKNKILKINIIIIHNLAEDLFNHIKEKPSKVHLEILIPLSLILFFNKNYIKTSNKTSLNKSEYSFLEYDINLLYESRLDCYLKDENIGRIIIKFIESISKIKYINSIENLASYQSYLENNLLKNTSNINKKWQGISIAIHGGIYGITYGYPIMFYQFEQNLYQSPTYLMPKHFIKHFEIDLSFYQKGNEIKDLNLVNMQYGFEILKSSKSNLFNYRINTNLFVFANNLLPQADPWIRNFKEFDIKETLIRWHKLKSIWRKGKVYIIVRPRCYSYLKCNYQKQIKDLKICFLRNPNDLLNAYFLFEGLSSAIREHLLKSKYSIVYLPINAFNLSKQNILSKNEIVPKEKIRIIRKEDHLFRKLKSIQ